MKGKCFRIAVLAALFLMVLTQAAFADVSLQAESGQRAKRTVLMYVSMWIGPDAADRILLIYTDSKSKDESRSDWCRALPDPRYEQNRRQNIRKLVVKDQDNKEDTIKQCQNKRAFAQNGIGRVLTSCEILQISSYEA